MHAVVLELGSHARGTSQGARELPGRKKDLLSRLAQGSPLSEISE